MFTLNQISILVLGFLSTVICAPIPASFRDLQSQSQVQFIDPNSETAIATGDLLKLKFNLNLKKSSYPFDGIRFQLYRAGAHLGMFSGKIEGASVIYKKYRKDAENIAEISIPRMAKNIPNSGNSSRGLERDYYVQAERVGAWMNGVLGKSDKFSITNEDAGQKRVKYNIIDYLSSPKKGSVWAAGSNLNITWVYDNPLGPKDLTIYLVRDRKLFMQKLAKVPTQGISMSDRATVIYPLEDDLPAADDYRLTFYIKRNQLFQSAKFAIEPQASLPLNA